MTFSDALNLVWPLTFLLATLLVLRRIRLDLGHTIWPLVKTHAEKHAMVYVIAAGMGLQAFGTGFYDNFWPIEPENMAKLGWWQVIAAFLKSCSFAIGIVVGYLLRGPSTDKIDAEQPKPPQPAPTP